MTTTRLFLVRHGPTHAKAMVGWTDLPADLSDTAQVARLDAALPSEALVISSDLSRAVATADAIQNTRPRLPHDRDLREIHFGDWEMQNWRDIEDQERLHAYWETPGDVSPPGGESWNAVSSRVNRAVDRLLRAHAGRDVILVAHFGVILTQVQRAKGLTGYETFAHKIDNLSLTEIHAQPTGWHLAQLNVLP
ncbi:MAG TPA: histidine phosphatase family protein [Rhodobacteraceae bacterium]|jgi:alpha-ribazole phosphatase|nr:histidine phosphatase family protein [Paracoccaceae bacterium]